MIKMYYIQRKLTFVSSCMKPVSLQTEAKAFMPGARPRYRLLYAGQEAVERCCGRSLLQARYRSDTRDNPVPHWDDNIPLSESDHSFERSRRDHVHYQESTGKK